MKNIENDNEKLKLNKRDLRQDYENFKEDCENKIARTKEVYAKNQYILNLRKKELSEKTQCLEQLKQDNEDKLNKLQKQYEDLCSKKKQLEEENKKIQEDTVQMEKDFMKKINDLNDEIDLNKKKEGDFMKEVKAIADQIAQLDKQIKEKQIEQAI